MVAQNSQYLELNANHDLIANDNDIQSSNGVAKSAIKQYEVLMRDADGESLVKWSGAANTAAIGISMTAAAANEQMTYWTAGGFFQHKLVWPTSADTIAKRRAAFDSSPLAIV